MAVINPFDKILLSINDKFSVASKKANESNAVKYGNARYGKDEARARLMRDLASKPSGPERAELIKKRGIDAVIDLLGKSETSPTNGAGSAFLGIPKGGQYGTRSN